MPSGSAGVLRHARGQPPLATHAPAGEFDSVSESSRQCATQTRLPWTVSKGTGPGDALRLGSCYTRDHSDTRGIREARQMAVPTRSPGQHPPAEAAGHRRSPEPWAAPPSH